MPASQHTRAEVRTVTTRNEGLDWCILRTSGPKTLPLARALAEAGLAIWTLVEIVSSDLTAPRTNTRGCVPGEVRDLQTSSACLISYRFCAESPFCKHKRCLTRALSTSVPRPRSVPWQC
jgi:hypothetical protein